MSYLKLKDKVAIITGGSRGIGKAIASEFLKEGANVVITSRTEDELRKTAAEFESYGYEVLAVKADISKKEHIKNLVNVTIEKFQTIDVLINNAGILGPLGKILDNDIDDWIKTIEINLIGTFLFSREVLPYMIEKKSGKIINLSGGGATYPRPGFSAYSTSKAAAVRFTETLAEEVKEFNIQVNAIAPGAVDTKMLRELIEKKELAGEKELKEAKRALESGKATPQKAASLAVFLASSESDGITGKLISAIWDPWRDWEKIGRVEIDKDLYVLRRIDGITYVKTNNERKS